MMGRWEDFKSVNPVRCLAAKTGVSIVCVIDLILGLIVVIGGVTYCVYLLYPQGFYSLEEFEAKFGESFYFKVKGTAKIGVFLICLVVMFHTLGEYGLFLTIRNALRCEDPNQCALWFEIRVSIHILVFGGFTTYGILIRPDSIATDLLTLSPLFIYRTFELWMVKYYEWTLPPIFHVPAASDSNLPSSNQSLASSVVKVDC